eukprot:TRINITY_DN39686_c0_g1_i1.p1 TRINITY_DN39686_c0_g1~~TRINITY_DN39686_c0_g1_i1.p1  ORF type:complete len:224 (+),score=26.27 TRINITY_DN39686_c0_g1_i1:40-711(+)
MYIVVVVFGAIALTLHGCSSGGGDGGNSAEGCGPGGQKRCPSKPDKCYCPNGYKYHVVKETFSTTVAYCISQNSTYEEVVAKTAVPDVEAKTTLGSGTAGRCQWCEENEQSSPDSTGSGACWTPAQRTKATCPQAFPFASGENNAFCAKSGYLGGFNEIFFRGLLNGQYWHCCKLNDWKNETRYCSKPYDCDHRTDAQAGTFTDAYQMATPCAQAPCATFGLD